MIRIKFLWLLSLVFIATFNAFAQNADVEAINSLALRIIPNHLSSFKFKKIPADNRKDCYTITGEDSLIVISGNNANSMAMGLNRYLKDMCHTTVSWFAEVPVRMPAILPVVKNPIKSTARVERRFFLNYCTYGYTMPFFSWNEWERVIDWMALNGINMPLAITGQEAVWYNVWKELGMSDIDIRSYFTGPSYLPWHRMANIDGWDGPLPMEWLDGQKELQQKILKRERELGMKPVLPAFSGHVPGALQKLYPEANIKYLGKWAGFKDEYRCHFLNPQEPLFAKIQKLYLEEQIKLFGTNHIYGLDPFNEVEPPSWEPAYLKSVSKNIYKSLTAVDKKAEWMQMAWVFFYDKKHWTTDRVKAFLSGVKTGKMSLLDYHCENTEIWKTTNKFFGQPYIWCYLGNFGGNTAIQGNVKECGEKLEKALAQRGNNFIGIGSTLEGFDVVQFPYEYLFDKAWTDNPSDSVWVNNLADRHYGSYSKEVREAWQILFNEIYKKVPYNVGILPSLRPILNNNITGRTSINYSKSRLIDAWKLLTSIKEANTNEMKLDIITVGRQVLGNKFLDVKKEFDSAYASGNVSVMKRNATIMSEILKDLDELNAFNERCTLSKWIDDARNLASDKDIKDYYEHDSRNIITTWGGILNDYACRTWSGLISSYYAKRWDLYTTAVINAAEKGIKFDQKALDSKFTEFENKWVNSKDKIQSVPSYDIVSFSRLIIDKYKL